MDAPLDVVAILGKCHLFRGLSADAFAKIAQAGHIYHCEPNKFIFYQNESAETFYVVLTGRVRLGQVTASGHQVIVHHVGPGGGLAVVAALSTSTYPLSAETIEPTSLIAWDGQTTSELMAEHALFALNALHVVIDRFQDLQNRYQELATERVDRRIARALLRLVQQAGRKTEEGVLIDMPISRQDIAEMTGTTVFTVSRTLSSWEQAGIVSSGRERIVICVPHSLVEIAEDLKARG